MKSNSTQVRDAARTYLIGCIMETDPKNWGKDTYDLKTRLEIIIDEFRGAANHPNNLQRFPNLQDRFTNWRWGLPSSLPIEFYTQGIIDLLTEWGLPNDKNYDSDKSVRLYDHIIYSELTKLFTQNDISL
jgi:hypothetical protein